MVEITDPDLNAALDHFEEMIESLDRYHASLAARLERYSKEGRDPAKYERVVRNSMRRTERLKAALEGEAYDLLRDVLDGSGTLASADAGRWI